MHGSVSRVIRSLCLFLLFSGGSFFIEEERVPTKPGKEVVCLDDTAGKNNFYLLFNITTITGNQFHRLINALCTYFQINHLIQSIYRLLIII